MKKYFLFIITLLLIIPGCSKLITITIKDSKGNILNTVKVQKGETLNSITAPTKDGYIFTSWTQSGMNISKDTVLNKDISITANYTEKPSLTKTYKIKFIIENEEKYQTINVGEKIKEPTKPRKNKYTFIGWYQGNELYDFNIPPTSDITLTAKFKKSMITINYDLSGGVGTTSYDILINTIPKKPSTPKKTGYKFICWTINNKVYNFDTPLSSDTTITATWQAINYVRISFDTDGGTIIKDKYLESGTKLDIIETPVKKDYIFAYWTLDGLIFDLSKEITDNITLKAVYTKE